MHVVRVLVINRSVLNLLVLALEEPHEPRPVVATVALRPEANTIVVGLVGRELEEPSLREMPQRVRRRRRAVGRVGHLLAGKGPRVVGEVVLGDPVGEVLRRDDVGFLEVAGPQMQRAVGGLVVGEADLDGLVDVKHVDLVVPAPGVEEGGLGVLGDHTGAVLVEEAHQGGAAGAAVEPDGEGGIGRVFAGLEEPEEAGSGFSQCEGSAGISTCVRLTC